MDRSVFTEQSEVLNGHATRLYLFIGRNLDQVLGRQRLPPRIAQSTSRPQDCVNVFTGTEAMRWVGIIFAVMSPLNRRARVRDEHFVSRCELSIRGWKRLDLWIAWTNTVPLMALASVYILERRYGTRLAPQVTGNTFPGATLPHGMAQLSPVLDPPKWPWRDRWRYNSGYHRVPSQHAARFLGVGHTALSGTGLHAGGDFLLSPCDGVGHLMHSAEYGEPGSYGGTILCPGGFPYRLDVAAALRGGILRISFGAVSPRRIVASLRSPLDALNRGHVWGDPDISGALFGMRSSNKTHHCGSARSASLARVE